MPNARPRFQLSSDERQRATSLIRSALEEDLHDQHDLTTTALVPEPAQGQVRIVSRKTGVLSGSQIAQMVFQSIDPAVHYEPVLSDGAPLAPGATLATLQGSAASLLIGERTALNFLTLLSGVATLTNEYVNAVAGTSAKILDTRKTLPGLRALQKYAVRCGGGQNHRIGLYDAVLIKDNHLAWWTGSHAANLATAVEQARERSPAGTVIEIEVDTLEQLSQVLGAQPNIVLLDNMPAGLLSRAVSIRDQQSPQTLLEASGGVNLETVRGLAESGVDRISIGALTHSAPALDIGFDWGG